MFLGPSQRKKNGHFKDIYLYYVWRHIQIIENNCRALDGGESDLTDQKIVISDAQGSNPPVNIPPILLRSLSIASSLYICIYS